MREIKAPQPFDDAPGPSLFVGGSIMDARDWQAELALILSDEDVTLFNPRREDFDPTQKQSADNDYFRGQVEWELAALEAADVILLHFEPNTKSPITLFELGMCMRRRGLIVSCPSGFWRKGNVDVVCNRYGIIHANSLYFAVVAVRAALKLLRERP